MLQICNISASRNPDGRAMPGQTTQSQPSSSALHSPPDGDEGSRPSTLTARTPGDSWLQCVIGDGYAARVQVNCLVTDSSVPQAPETPTTPPTPLSRDPGVVRLTARVLLEQALQPTTRLLTVPNGEAV